MYKNAKRKYPTTKPKPKRKPLPRRVSTAKPTVTLVKSIVKKALDNRIENKTLVTNGTLSIHQAAALTIISSFNLIPICGQGTSESQRIGNSIKMKNCYLKGFLRYSGQGLQGETPVSPGNFHVRIFIGKLKSAITSPSSTVLGTLLRSGSVPTAFDSRDGLSLTRTVNTEVFNVYYDKIFKLGASGPSNNAAAYSAITGMNNNDYKLNYIISIPLTKMVKNTWTYEDGTLVPTNTGLYMWAGIVDSIASDSTNANPLAFFDFDIKWSYEDA